MKATSQKKKQWYEYFHSYADTQLYVSVKPDDPNTLSNLTDCVSAMNEWMRNNSLKLNKDKTEILPGGPKKKRDRVLAKLGHLASQTRPQVRNLGVILVSDLNF